MNNQQAHDQQQAVTDLAVKKSSDTLMNYFILGYFVIGLLFAFTYDTWMLAISAGGIRTITGIASTRGRPRPLFFLILDIDLAMNS